MNPNAVDSTGKFFGISIYRRYTTDYISNVNNIPVLPTEGVPKWLTINNAYTTSNYIRL